MVNTFLPYADFQKTARTLDYKRLGKQRVEAHQIINILESKNKITDIHKTRGWQNHPATLMWKGYLPYLKQYYNAIVEEWIRRGYVNNMPLYTKKQINTTKSPPWWLGFKPLHYAYQASLLRKNKTYYSKYFSQEKLKKYMKYSYVWPSKLNPTIVTCIKNKKDMSIGISKFKIEDLSLRYSSI
jgi:hypothetical protein